jgi:Cytochrome domain of cellobiose dehydrogenase
MRRITPHVWLSRPVLLTSLDPVQFLTYHRSLKVVSLPSLYGLHANMAVFKQLLTLGAAYFLILSAMAEPVQYCRFGAKERPNEAVDFCMGLTMHHNLSSNTHDLYLSMTVTRPGGSAVGWTAIGIGETMVGGLMFIVYGDPLTSEIPIISIRGSTGHAQPKLVTRADMGGADIRVLRSAWMPTSEGFTVDNPTYIATISLVCYSCGLWPGTPISAFSKSQPWMWAWNNKMEFPVFAYDTHLLMHTHHAGQGGFGNFYVDMARSVNTAKHQPSFPPIRPHIETVGVSEWPASGGALEWLSHNPALHLHGIFMGLAFLFLFPAGVVAMRSGSPKSFKYHWIVQLLASIFTTLGVIAGLSLGQPINTVHQGVGIAIASSIGIQGVLGWRHHMNFLQIRRRTWISYAHIWLGRAMMVAGWSNLVSGMVLRGYQQLCIIIMAIAVSLELAGLSFFVWWKYRRSTQKDKAEGFKAPWRKDDENNKYFALGTADDEDDDEDSASGGDEKNMLSAADREQA